MDEDLQIIINKQSKAIFHDLGIICMQANKFTDENSSRIMEDYVRLLKSFNYLVSLRAFILNNLLWDWCLFKIIERIADANLKRCMQDDQTDPRAMLWHYENETRNLNIKNEAKNCIWSTWMLTFLKIASWKYWLFFNLYLVLLYLCNSYSRILI